MPTDPTLLDHDEATSQQFHARDPVSLSASHFWSSAYVARMLQELGPDACRKLAIFELPSDFELSVVVPVYNEEATVPGVVDRLRATGLPLQIILVDDGSSDGTGDALNAFENAPDVILIRHKVNRGKGAALRSGFEAATGEIVVVQDADDEYDPTDYRYLLQPLIGERRMLRTGHDTAITTASSLRGGTSR